MDNPVPAPAVQRAALAPLDSLFPLLHNLPRTPPRREKLPGLSLRNSPLRSLGAILPLALFVPLIFVVMIMATAQNRKSAVSRGQATGKIVLREKIGADLTGGNATPSQWFLKYRFAVQGQVYEGNTLENGDSALSALAPGSPLIVFYQLQNPAQNQPLSQVRQMEKSGDFTSIWPILLVFPPLILLFVAGPLLGGPLRGWWKAHRLYPRAVLCNGTVEWVKPRAVLTPNGHSGGGSEVTYRFRDNAGLEHSGKMPCDNAWLVNQLGVGSPVVVAYDPQKPERSIFLEAFAS